MKCYICKYIPSGGPGPHKKFKLNETSEIANVSIIESETRPEFKIKLRLGNIMCSCIAVAVAPD